MISPYNGHHLYNQLFVSLIAPDTQGVYYCGRLMGSNLETYYVGKSNSIRGRLLEHIRNENWSDVTHFGFVECSSALETQNVEIAEIQRLGPKYNTHYRLF